VGRYSIEKVIYLLVSTNFKKAHRLLSSPITWELFGLSVVEGASYWVELSALYGHDRGM